VSQQLLFVGLVFSKSDMVILNEIKDSLSTHYFVFGKMGKEQIMTGVPLLVTESEVGMVLIS
jgi:DNA mismatch repair protein MutL